MSQTPPGPFMATPPGGNATSSSASASEINAGGSSSPTVLFTKASARTEAPALKLRSCVTCRSRKVRCDRLTPCSNCQRAGVTCVIPSINRTPRWARHLRENGKTAAAGMKVTQDPEPAARVLERLRSLDGLVRELSSQLEQPSVASLSTSSRSSVNSPGAPSRHEADHHLHMSSAVTGSDHAPTQFGSFSPHDASKSRYVSRGFWSRVNDELEALSVDTQALEEDELESPEDEQFLENPSEQSPSTQEIDRTPLDRHAFMFSNVHHSMPNLREYHPLPSQIPFLLDVFSNNVNSWAQIVHIPSVTKMVRDWRDNNMADLSPANEALMFSLYYAAITSMEEDDVMTNFSSTKTDLNLKYRLGLEYALARADFLNNPSIVSLQAFAIFLCLARRHDSPRFVWIMTGLVIRMAQALGLHRDGARLPHLTPFEVEMRRRVWWLLCMLDVRASEDQGTDLTITSSSFDTKIPLNINDNDIGPETQKTPVAREGITDMTLALVWAEMFDTARRMIAPGTKDQEDPEYLLNQLCEKLDRGFLQYAAGESNVVYSVGVIVVRVVIAKMTLISHLPVLFSSRSDHFSEDLRTKLLVSAIEVAEYNDVLNSEQAYRHWRWIFQTYTHWHSIIYTLIEISRRPWSPLVERAWVALQSRWLIPTQSKLNKNLSVWGSLQKLIAKARKHRESELDRLHGDARATELLDVEYCKLPVPASSGDFPTKFSAENFRERWYQLLRMHNIPEDSVSSHSSIDHASQLRSSYDTQLGSSSLIPVPTYGQASPTSNMSHELSYHPLREQVTYQGLTQTVPSILPSFQNDQASGSSLGAFGTFANSLPAVSKDRADIISKSSRLPGWLLPDMDPADSIFADINLDEIDVNMDLNEDMDWHGWIESAKIMESNTS